MAINSSDIKLLESEVMADTTDGGGRRTSRVIPDGVAGNIFPKVSRLDSVYGRVNLRKIYGAIQTANRDTYAGAHAVITDAPDNDRIHCTLFSTASEFDTRNSARDRIESYVTSGPESRMTLLGRQLTGQQSVVAYQRVEEPLPEVGDVYCLSTESGATVTAQQYFRVQTIDAEVRTFTETIGSTPTEFTRRVLTIGTGSPLRYDFNGPENASQLSNVTRPTKLRTTTFVDAARYFGIRPTAELAAQNALAIKVDTVYSPIVPTTNRETPLANVALNGAAGMRATKAGTRSEVLTSAQWANGASFRTLRGIMPGSLQLSGSGGGGTSGDDKKGNINTANFVGIVDYQNGIITRTGGSATSTTFTAVYTPAVSAGQIAHSREIPITLANRGAVYVLTLLPIPAPGSASIDFRALGKWYRLRDNGDGTVTGDDPAYGAGTIDYATGSAVVTLGALPDIGSSLIVSFGSPVHYVIRSGASTNAPSEVVQRLTLPDVPIAADSLSLTYTSGGVQYTATDNAAGTITGNGITGTVNYVTGDVTLRYTTRLPDALTSVSFSYDQITATVNGEEAASSGTFASAPTIDLGGPVVAGTIVGSLPFAGKSLLFRDVGGVLTVYDKQYAGTVQNLSAAVVEGDQAIGSVNYSTGVLTFTGTVTVSGQQYQAPVYLLGAGTTPVSLAAADGAIPAGSSDWSSNSIALARSSGSAIIGWRKSGVSTVTSPRSSSIGFTTAPLRFPLRSTIGDNIVPDSLVLSIGGKTYIDRNGILYADVNTSGAGTTAGAVNYESGEVELSFWTNGAALSIAVDCCLSVYGQYTAAEVFFRTGGSPIRPGSFFIQATTTGGDLLSGTADTNGNVTGTKVHGRIDQETGVVTVRFGQMVTAAGNESQYWYDSDNVVAGQIWKPEFIIPSTLRYNAVVLSNLPLNADILGLDPVRLPTDGRVPIYRPADVVVIHNTQSTTLTNPVTAGATYSAGRTMLAELWVEDQEGVKLTSGQYSANLDAGTVTIAADFVAGSLVQPLVVKHRIEDMNLLTDVQINGDLSLASPLSREYPAGSLVSSAMLFGDMDARVTNVFDLLAFSTWSNTPGTQATAQYNNIDYPIEVLNNGSVTERWRINFTSTTAFQVIGENLGVIATGTTSSDCAPANQLTGLPYFIIRAAGWGSGWAAGNNLRFNTVSAAAPIWIARTVLPGATLDGDSMSVQMRGDVDA